MTATPTPPVISAPDEKESGLSHSLRHTSGYGENYVTPRGLGLGIYYNQNGIDVPLPISNGESHSSSVSFLPQNWTLQCPQRTPSCIGSSPDGMEFSPASLNPSFQDSASLSAQFTEFSVTSCASVDISSHYVPASGLEDLDLGYSDILDMYLGANPTYTDTSPMNLTSASWRETREYHTSTSRSSSSISPAADSSDYNTRSFGRGPDDPGPRRLENDAKVQQVTPETTKHPRSNSPTKQGYRCHICGLLFTRRANCREHIKRHDPNHQKEHYVCEKCGKTVSRKTDLKRHYLSVSFSNDFLSILMDSKLTLIIE